MQIRRNRLHADEGENKPAYIDKNEYLDEEKIEEEVRKARRMFSKNKWPVIDVTKKSVEETAAEIMTHLQNHQEGTGE